MRFYALALVSLFLCSSCKNNANLAQDSRVLKYQVEGNRYAVVVVRDSGLSEADAKKMAMQNAASLAQKKGYRYFVVQKEGPVVAMGSNNPSGGNPPPPSNMYYEQFQSRDFGRDTLQNQNPPSSEPGTYPAYQVVFACFTEDNRPAGAVDVCTLIECSKS